MKLPQRLFPLLVVLFALPSGGLAVGNYTVSKKTVEGHVTYHLLDSSRKMDVGIVPDIGNFAYEFKVNGKDALIPPESFKSYLEKRWFCCGIPFLAPYANRIDHDYYFFQGKKYLLNAELGNLLRDGANQPIHGLLVFDTRWQVVKADASDAGGAVLTSRLDFYKYPDLMAQFPFAHTIDMTYRLKDGKLENTTEIRGHEAMPIDIAYHPYFRPDGPRENWTVSIGARDHWIPADHTRLIPTGAIEPADKYVPNATNFVLGKTFIDDNFSNLLRDSEGRGHLWVKGESEKIEVVYGREYDFAVVYAPLDNTLICFEPQTGPTNAFNLNHEGKFPGLIVLEPDKTFRASFWIVPTGF